MEALATLILGMIIAGVILFIATLILMKSLYGKIKNRSPRLAKNLLRINIVMLALPFGLWIYQVLANSQSRDTNDTWLIIIGIAPFMLAGVVILLIGAHVYLKFKAVPKQ